MVCCTRTNYIIEVESHRMFDAFVNDARGVQKGKFDSLSV
jgi:hypothetical protein